MAFEHLTACRDSRFQRRRIFFGDGAVTAIRAWLEIRPDVDHDHVFTSARGKGPLTAHSISQIIRRLSRKVGLKRSLGAHSLRHRVGMTLARQHVPVRVAQAYLGHARPEITFGYCQDVDESDLHDAGKLLGLHPDENDDEDDGGEGDAGEEQQKTSDPAG